MAFSIIYNFFPTFTFLVFMIHGGNLKLGLVVVGQDYINRVFHCFNLFPSLINWISEFMIWEGKVVAFLQVPNQQKGLLTQRKLGDQAVHIKGDFSWGFVEKSEATLDECLTLRHIDL